MDRRKTTMDKRKANAFGGGSKAGNRQKRSRIGSKEDGGKLGARQKPKKGDAGLAGEKVLWKPGNMLYPVPAVMVSCMRPGEKPNIITVAWAGTVCSDPPMVSISVRKERYSYGIIKETGEFVINLVTARLVMAADFCGVKSGRDRDKFREAGLTPQMAGDWLVPGIKESPVHIRCRVSQIIPLGSHDLFLAEVRGVAIDPEYLDEKGKLRLNDAGLAAYSHGEYYGLGKKIGAFGYSVKKSPAGGGKGGRKS